jgi:tRNA-specific 2-thiouridylase
MGLRTAGKPDSQDVCFITSTGGRETFLGDRIAFRPGRVVDTDGAPVGSVDAVEMITIGQRRGIGLPGGGPKRYVVDVDVPNAEVVVGDDDDLFRTSMDAARPTWVDGQIDGDVLVQCSAHGTPMAAGITVDGDRVRIDWERPQRRIAPGQSVVFYDLDDRCVLGGATAAR